MRGLSPERPRGVRGFWPYSTITRRTVSDRNSIDHSQKLGLAVFSFSRCKTHLPHSRGGVFPSKASKRSCAFRLHFLKRNQEAIRLAIATGTAPEMNRRTQRPF